VRIIKEDAVRKEELESLLGCGDLSPIEEQLHALATERQLPDLAVALCTVRVEESGPALRAILTRAADGEALSDDEKMLAFRGLHILGGTRESQACAPLLRLLRRAQDEIDHLLGDAVTESLARIVAGVFDGDVDALFGMIADSRIDEYVRKALLGAATFLTWEGRIEHPRMRRLLDRFYEERLAADDDYAWIGWLEAIALLGLRDLAPLVYSAWDNGRIPLGVLERSHFESDLVAAEQRPRDVERFKRANLGYIEDALEALDWTRGTKLLDEENLAPFWPESTLYPTAPTTNPFRHVGRNDPCPCGSGNKYKKCCLANEQS
jgi:Protein of unknown function (DUF1186)/SEC-C motif